jgi:hypothetical protein
MLALDDFCISPELLFVALLVQQPFCIDVLFNDLFLPLLHFDIILLLIEHAQPSRMDFSAQDQLVEWVYQALHKEGEMPVIFSGVLEYVPKAEEVRVFDDRRNFFAIFVWSILSPIG